MTREPMRPTPGKSPDGEQYLLFAVDSYSFALPVTAVKRVIPSVLVSTVPKSPATVLGMINLHGTSLPVVDFRKKFGLARRQIRLEDKFLVLEANNTGFAICVEKVLDITDPMHPADHATEVLIPGVDEQIPGILLFDREIYLIYDLGKVFLEDALKTIGLFNRKASQRSRKQSKK